MGIRISIIGTGYVGLVTGVCLADKGHDVTCVDIDRAKVDRINRGEAPIHEAGLDELLRKHAGKSLRATTDLNAAVQNSAISFIAVGTPFDGQEIDLKYIRETALQIGAALKAKPGYHVVVVKSTVVPGTTDATVLPLLERASGKTAGEDFGVGMNPEFLSEGVAIPDFMNPDRIVLGGLDARTVAVMDEVYAPFVGIPVLRTNCKTAEMIKYASNALQATAISFANELGNLCANLGGIDAVDVMAGMHLMKELNPRVSNAGGNPTVRAAISSFLFPGCGFGGSCFPKDVKALAAHAKKSGATTPMLESVLAINAEQPRKLTAILRKHLDDLRGVRIAVLGLAFKPGTDDVRESPAIPVVNDLLAAGAIVRAYDPIATEQARKVLGDKLEYAKSLPEAIEGASAVVLVTRWEEFRQLPQLIKGMHPQPLLVDGRRLIAKDAVGRYAGIGL
jgi:UDPglucose 6-dehydrogenase/GDP-mannose 6-dehydrogenase